MSTCVPLRTAVFMGLKGRIFKCRQCRIHRFCQSEREWTMGNPETEKQNSRQYLRKEFVEDNPCFESFRVKKGQYRKWDWKCVKGWVESATMSLMNDSGSDTRMNHREGKQSIPLPSVLHGKCTQWFKLFPLLCRCDLIFCNKNTIDKTDEILHHDCPLTN